VGHGRLFQSVKDNLVRLRFTVKKCHLLFGLQWRRFLSLVCSINIFKGKEKYTLMMYLSFDYLMGNLENE
jgi:hypothetical protein